MDLSDGSDVEGDVELDENALLGSDDEEGPIASSASTTVNKPKGMERRHSSQVEDNDVLDLDFSKDDLEFGDMQESNGRQLPPVQVRHVAAVKSETSSAHTQPNLEDDFKEEEYMDEEDYGGRGKFLEEDDEEDEDKNTRTRFHSERKSETPTTGGVTQMGMGNPIQILGHLAPMPSDGNRGQRGRGRHPHQHGHPNSMGNRQRFQGPRNALLGDRPRFHHLNRPHGGHPEHHPNPSGTHFSENMYMGVNQNRMGHPVFPPPMFPASGEGHYDGQGQGIRMPPTNGPPMNRPTRPPTFYPRQGPGPRFNPRHQSRQFRPRAMQNVPAPHSDLNQWRQPEPGHYNVPQIGPPPPPVVSQQSAPPASVPQFHEAHPQPQSQPHHHQVHPMPPQQNLPFPNQPPLRMFHSNPPPHQPMFGEPQQNLNVFEFPLNAFQTPVMQPQPFGQFGFPPNTVPLGYAVPQVQAAPQPAFLLQQHQQPHFMHLQQQEWQESQPQPQSFAPNLWPTIIATSAPQVISSTTPNYSSPQKPFIGSSEGIAGRPMMSFDRSQQDSQVQHERRPPDYEKRDYDNRASRPRTPSPDRHRSSDYRSKDSYHDSSKRKFDRDTYRGSPEKQSRRPNPNGRVESRREPSPLRRDPKTEELQRIREETKKTIGLDDDYIRKLEQQKRLREEVLKKKAASRKKVTTGEEADDGSKVSTTGVTENLPSTTTRPSIYVNPKTYKGDLAKLKAEGAGIITNKPRKVLKIVKDKQGNILSKCKVIYVPKQQQDGHTTSA